MPIPIIPPGGFQGFAQQTPAVQALLRRPAATRRKTGGRRKKTTRKKATGRKRRATAKPARNRRAARLVKGSAAAKRHMAKLRKMRRR